MSLSQGNVGVIILATVFSLLAIVAVGLRFQARKLKRSRLGVDDYLILPALAFAVGLGINNVVGAVEGNLGGHVPLGPDGLPAVDESMTVFLQTEFAEQILSVLCLTFTKMSIVSFYRRIFRGRVFETICWILTAIIVGWGISFFFATLFECYPIHQLWTTFYGQPGRRCYNYLPMFYATAISNMVIDIAILTVPWPMVWRLQMPVRYKVAICSIFLLGAFVCGISIARIYFFYQAGKGFDNDYDVTYNLAPTLYWTQLEGAIAVVSACLPTMRPLFAGLSIDTILNSLRSKLSLHSRRNSPKSSLHSHEGDHSAGAIHGSTESGLPSSLHRHPALIQDSRSVVIEYDVEGLPMKNVPSQESQRKRGIMVQKSFLQESV